MTVKDMARGIGETVGTLVATEEITSVQAARIIKIAAHRLAPNRQKSFIITACANRWNAIADMNRKLGLR